MFSLLQKWFEFARQNKGKVLMLGLVKFFVFRYVYIVLKRKIRREPPGPIGLPIVGAAHLRGKKGDFGIRLAKKYGPICQVSMGPSLIYILNHSDLVKQVILKEHVYDRQEPNPKSNTFIMLANDNNVLSFAGINGELWARRRRLALSLLTNIPSKVLSNIANESLGKVIFPYLDGLVNSNNNNKNNNKKGEEWWMRDQVIYYAFNTIYHYNVGQMIDYNNELWKKYGYLTNKAFRMTIGVIWYNIFPFLRKLDSFKKYKNIRIERTNLILRLIKTRIDIRRNIQNNKNNTKTSDTVSEHETYIDKMLEFEQKGELTKDEVEVDIETLFAAGTDTTAATLETAVLLIAKYQDMQEKMRQNLFTLWKKHGSPLMPVKGKYRQYNLQWKLTPDTKNISNEFGAFLLEIMRLTSVAGRGVAHYTSDKSFDLTVKPEHGTIDGKEHTYRIPKNTTIVYNTEYIQLRSKFEKGWKHNVNSDEFCLENWLQTVKDENGNNHTKLIKATQMPYTNFGIGKRDCVGKRLAENEVEIFLGNLLLNYRVGFNTAKYGTKPHICVKRAVVPRVEPQMSVCVERI